MRGFARNRELIRLAVCWLASTALTAPAQAAVVDYPNGSTNAAPIVLTDNSTQLQVLNGSATQSGVISEAGGSFGVEKIGSGTLTLTGANTYTGGTTINGGTLTLASGGGPGSGTLAPTGAIIINAGTFSMTSKTFTFGALSGTGGTLSMGGSFLTFDSSSNTTFAGQIADFGSGQFTKAGAGTLTLTGNSASNPAVVISGGTLQFGDGGTSGVIQTNRLTNNGRLVFNRSDNFEFAGTISGSGSVTKQGAGRLALSSTANTYTGGTVISAGTLSVNSLPGDVSNAGALVMGFAGSYGGVISGTGSVQVANGGGRLDFTAPQTYTGGTTIADSTLRLGAGGSLASTGALTLSGGIFDLNDHAQTVGALSGSSGTILLGSGALTTSSDLNTTLAASITGTGSLTKAGSGTLNLTGNNSYTGGTTISAGTLAVSSLPGNVSNAGALVLGFSGAYGGVISGTGSVTKSAAGTLTLSGVNSYTGATAVNAGTLNVTGKIASSPVNVTNGATLSGTGTVGATTIASGGTLTPGSGGAPGTLPGSGGAPGTLTVSGNLALGSGANFVDFITPTSAGQVLASGTASINGSATANFASGSYMVGQRFTLITAGGGLSGSFASLSTTGLSPAFKGRLSYDASNVYLNLDPNTLTPLLSNATGNQSNVAKAIDSAVLAGATLPAGFQALYNLSGPGLNSALDQLAGPIGPNITNSVSLSFQSFLSFTGQGGDGGSNFAPGSAYGSAAAPHRAQLGVGEMRVWGGAYGGHVGLSGDPVSGAASLSGTNAGLVGGADMQIADGLLVGATFGWGGQDFRSGNGTGTSDDVALGLYARHESGPLYISAVLGFGWHHIETRRTVTVSGTDVLQGIQDATNIGGRLEAGWHLALDETYRVTPYAAFMGESLDSPGYAETAVSGASTFALSVARHTDALGRMEMGARLGRDYALEDGTLAADLQAAWAHQINDVPLTQATFLGLPGASFAVAGVRPARDAALLGGALEVRKSSGFFLGVRGETLLGDGTTTVEGMGSLGWRW